MTVGKRNRLIQLQRNDGGESDFESDPDNWKTYRQVWAEIKPATGSENEFAEGLQTTVSHTIEIAFPFAEVRTTDRIVYENRVFNIGAVINVSEGNHTLMILAVEVVGVV